MPWLSFWKSILHLLKCARNQQKSSFSRRHLKMIIEGGGGKRASKPRVIYIKFTTAQRTLSPAIGGKKKRNGEIELRKEKQAQ